MSLEEPYEGQKFSSFEVLKKYLEEYGRKNYIKFWIRSSHRIGSLKSKAMKKVNPSLKYVCMKFACIFGGEKIRCRGSGIRRSSTFRNLGCPCTINAVVGEDGNHVKLETVVLEHNHLLSKTLFETRKGFKNKLEMVGTEVAVKNIGLTNKNSCDRDLVAINGEISNNEMLKETKEEGSDAGGGDGGAVEKDYRIVSIEQNNIQEYFKQIQQKYGSNIKIIVVKRDESEKVDEEETMETEKESLKCEFAEEDEEAECNENIDELEQLRLSAEKDVCRLCLSASNKLTPIFKPSLPLESTILSFKIMSCASIEISNNDELPCNICSTCEEILDIAYNFRMRCENSDSVLRKFYSSNRFVNVNGLSNGYSYQKDDDEDVKSETKEELETEQKEAEYQEVMKEEGETVTAVTGEVENVAGTEVYVKFSETCPICENAFESYPDMLEHLKEHSDAENYLLTCNLCNVIFTTVRALLEHLNEHVVHVSTDWTNRLIACTQCDMTFLTEEDARAHGERHTVKEELGSKNSGSGYLCNICGKILKSKDRFQSHRNTHEGLRPHICFKCGRGFADRKNMHQHYDIVHLRKAKHECPICHKKFYAPTKMKSHITMHYGVKPFACDVCNKTFRLRMNMIKHKKTHSNERPHKCDKCSAAFIDKNLLTRHSYVHGGVRPYVCPFCAHRFTLKFNLKKHMTSGRCSGRGKVKAANSEVPIIEWENQTEDSVLAENKCEDGEQSEFTEGSESMKMDMLQEYGEKAVGDGKKTITHCNY